jgi:chemotaxis protein CheX
VRLMTQEELNSTETQNPISDLLQSVMDSICQMIPVPASVQPLQILEETVVQNDIGVLVGITGDFYGRMVIQGEGETFGKIGESMYGMLLEGDILLSFVGEMANMVAGNTATLISNKGRKIDITPPTVMVGKLQLHGFEQGISVPVDFEKIGRLNIILMIQNQGAA